MGAISQHGIASVCPICQREDEKVDEIKGPFLFYEFALTISADGRAVLCTHPERPNSGLLVVEDSQ
jgi:hypothetical protein